MRPVRGVSALAVVLTAQLLASCGESDKHSSSAKSGSGGSAGSAVMGGSGGSQAGGGSAGVPITTIPPVSGTFGAFMGWAAQAVDDGFPVTPNAAQPERVPGEPPDGYDGAVARFAQHADGTIETKFATYLGGNGNDAARVSATDAQGNVYVAGYSESTDFPTLNPIQAANAGFRDIVVVKYGPDGTPLFSTYLGGSDYDDAAAIAIDATGVYVGGRSTSPNYPTTAGVVQPTYAGHHQGFATWSGGGDMVVTKLALDGSAILWSTYIGGSWSEEVVGMHIDGDGSVYIVGATESLDFPTTNNAYQKAINGMPSNENGTFFNFDAVILELNPSASALEFSTLLGGGDFDTAQVVSKTTGGRLLVGGGYNSSDFPQTSAPQLGGQGAYLAELSADGASLLHVFQLNTTGSSWVSNILERANVIYVAGTTEQAGLGEGTVFQATYGGGRDTYVAQMSSDLGRAERFTYVGGAEQDPLNGAAFDAAGHLHLFLMTESPNLPRVGSDTPYGGSGLETYWIALEPDLSRADFGAYLGAFGYGSGSLKSATVP